MLNKLKQLNLLEKGCKSKLGSITAVYLKGISLVSINSRYE